MQRSTSLPEPRALRLEPLWVLLGFCALAIAWTWPVAANLNTRVPHDAGDPLLVVWILWWNAQVTPFTEAWWNAPMMWPMAGAMTLSEHLVGLGLVATPLQLAGANPVTAYNVCFLLTFALSGFFAFLLGRRLTGSTFAGICAGIAFGFAPYRASQLAHMQVLSAQWMPLALLGLHAFLATGATRWLAVFAIAWLIQALSNNYFLLFFPVLVVAWLAWFVDWRRAPRRGLAIVATWVAASLPLLPVLLKYREVHEALGLTRKVAEIRDYSAMPASFLHAAPLMKFWREGPAPTYEQYLFTGVTVVLLALAGLILLVITNTRKTRGPLTANRAPILFYAAATLLMWVLALGPGGHGEDAGSPYPSLHLAALAAGLRRPPRVITLRDARSPVPRDDGEPRGWAPVEADSLHRTWGRPLAPTRGPCRHRRSPGRRHDRPGPRRHAPRKSDSAWFATGGGHRVAGRQHRCQRPGHVSIHLSRPPARQRLLGALSAALQDPVAVARAPGFDGPLLSGTAAAARHRRERSVRSEPQLPGHGRKPAGHTAARCRRCGIGIPPAGAAGAARTADRAGAPGDRPRRRPVLLEFDLGEPRLLSAVTFPLRRRYEELAGRLRIETSDNGQTWTESWVGQTGGMAVEATLADPNLAPMRIPLAGVRARYLRVYPASEWMKTELTVHEQF